MRTERIEARLTRSERRQLEARAAQFGISLSEYLRALIAAADKRVREPSLVLDDGTALDLREGRVK